VIASFALNFLCSEYNCCIFAGNVIAALRGLRNFKGACVQKNFFNQKISGFFSTFLLAVAVAVLSGCGSATSGVTGASGVGSSGSSSTTLTVTVATGAMLNNATVVAVDSNGVLSSSVTTGTNGQATLSLSGLTPPLLLRATPPSGSPVTLPMYSLLPTLSGSSLNVDITPVTTLVVMELNGGVQPSNMFTNPALFSTLTRTQIESAASSVLSKLNAAFSGVSAAQTALDNVIVNGVDVMGYTGGPIATTTYYDVALDQIGQMTYPINGGTVTFATGNTAYTPTSTAQNSVTGITVTPSSASIYANGASSVQVSATVTGTTSPVNVTFSTTAGTLSATTATTSNGVATVNLTAPVTIGTATVTASAGSASGSTQVTFTAGAIGAVGVNAAPNSVAPSGAAGTGKSTITVAVVDTNGNPVQGALVAFTFAATGSGSPKLGQINYPPLLTSVSNATNNLGIAQVAYQAGAGSGMDTVQAQVGSLKSSTSITVSTSSVTIPSVTVSASKPSITANGSSLTTISANVGVAVSGVPVTFAITSNTGGMLSATTANTDNTGVASVNLQAGTTASIATVTATAGGFSGSTSVVFTAGAAAVIGTNAAPNAVNPNSASVITAAVLDGNGNPVPNAAVDFSFAATGSASGVAALPTLGLVGNTPPSLTPVPATPFTVYTDINGLAKVAYLAGPANGADKIQAVVGEVKGTNGYTGGYTSTTSIAVSAASTTVGSVALNSPMISIPVQIGNTISSTTILATVKTISGAPAAGVTVTFSTSSGSVSPATAITDATGVAVTTLSAGTTVLTAKVTASVSGFYPSMNVNFTAGAANTVTVSAAPGTVKPTSGSATISALVTDANGNPVIGENVSFAITTSGSGLPTLSSASVATNANGLATITYTAGSGNGADVITATSSNNKSGNTTVVVNSSAIVVGAIALNSGAASLPTGGSCTAIVATVTDNAGLPASGVQVGFTTTAGSLATSVTLGNGTASAVGATSGTINNATTDSNGTVQEYLCSSSKLATATVTASASGFAKQVVVQFVASNPSSISLLASPASVNAGGTSTLGAVVRDAQGNPVVGQTVNFAVSTNNSVTASVTPATAVTDANGVVTVTYTAGNTAGVDKVSATVANVTPATVNITVNASATIPASLTLSASPTTVQSDGLSNTTLTVTALSANNTALSNVIVSLNSSVNALNYPINPNGASGVSAGGVLTALGGATVTTGANGQATFTFNSGTFTADNRTVTITATAAAASGVYITYPVKVVGSTVTASNSTGSSVTTGGGTTQTLTFTAKDAGGNLVTNAPITVTQAPVTGSATVTFSGSASQSGFTDSVTGQYSVTVAGGPNAGTVNVTATALGAQATSQFTVTGTPFGIAETLDATTGVTVTNPTATAMSSTDSLIVLVNAPSSTSVQFASTMGAWTASGVTPTTTTAPTVPVNGAVCSANGITVTPTTAGPGTVNQVCAVLTVPGTAGLANVQVTDPLQLNSSNSASLYNASLAVSVTSPANAAANVTLQASPGVVPKGSGGVSTLIATVTDASGLPVGGVPVAFSIPQQRLTNGVLVTNPTGGGESVSPVVAYTASTAGNGLGLGQAFTTFTAGSLSSSPLGVQIDVLVPGTAASGVGSVVIGGTAGSIAFGQATSLVTSSDGTSYILNMSALVADSNGSPAPQGTVVNVSAWPLAWSTGSACTIDADTPKTGTFYNEDLNENLILDAGEDGYRQYYYSGAVSGVVGTITGKLVPPNSAAGVVQSSNAADLLLGASVVTTNANGLASFTLTYPKTSALYIIDRIRARTIVQGTEAVGEVVFRLAGTTTDIGPPCLLPNSSFHY
jgi:protocatechuate 3,4-dioxygenase beta subunit